MGNSGSGKTTLARALARESALAQLDLDTLAWGAAIPMQRRPLSESVAALSVFMAANERWVVEGCYSDLLAGAVARCTRLVLLNPGVDACIANCRARAWEPHKYSSREAQDANLAMLIEWVRAYETRRDEFSLHSHRALFDAFRGEKAELSAVPRTSDASG